MNKQVLILQAPCCLTQNSMLITVWCVGDAAKRYGQIRNGMNTNEYERPNPDISVLILSLLWPADSHIRDYSDASTFHTA